MLENALEVALANGAAFAQGMLNSPVGPLRVAVHPSLGSFPLPVDATGSPTVGAAATWIVVPVRAFEIFLETNFGRDLRPLETIYGPAPVRPPPFVPQALDPAAVIPQVDVLPVQVPAVQVPAVVQGAQPPAPDPVPVPVAPSSLVLSDEAIANNIAEFQYYANT